MSSMRNAVTRRPHKERSQPKAREKWGILEKHKDYSLRAKDYNLKKAKLAILTSKARERNPDEFAFGMLSAGKASQGKHGRGDEGNLLSHDAVKLLKSQDAGYLRTVAGRGRRELERLGQAVALDGAMAAGKEGGNGLGKKTVFVDGEDVDREGKRGQKRKAESMNGFVTRPATTTGSVETDWMDMVDTTNDIEAVSESATKPESKTKKAKQTAQQAKLDLRAARKRRKRLGELRAAKLEALKKRQKEVMAVADQLELQRAKMSRAVGGVNKDGVKWKIRERKK